MDRTSIMAVDICVIMIIRVDTTIIVANGFSVANLIIRVYTTTIVRNIIMSENTNTRASTTIGIIRERRTMTLRISSTS